MFQQENQEDQTNDVTSEKKNIVKQNSLNEYRGKVTDNFVKKNWRSLENYYNQYSLFAKLELAYYCWSLQ